MADRALADKRLHEWGYRYTWPPTVDALTPRQRRRPHIAAHAEAYIKQQQRGQSGRGNQQKVWDKYGV